MNTSLKQKISHEMAEYWITVGYLAIFFGAFAMYRRLILAHYQISYGEYGIALIKALILAKVIMLGDMLRLGRRLEGKPLIFPTIYKAFLFSVWIIVFSVAEHMIKGLFRGQGALGGIEELLSKGMFELLANCVVIFFSLIPFFAFRELERVVGVSKIREQFFRKSSTSAF